MSPGAAASIAGWSWANCAPGRPWESTTQTVWASAEVGHHAFVDFAGEEALEAPDDLSFRTAVSRAARHVGGGRRVVLHAHDNGAVERGVRASVPASVEAVATPAPSDAAVTTISARRPTERCSSGTVNSRPL